MADASVATFTTDGSDELWVRHPDGELECLARVGYEGNDPTLRMLDQADAVMAKLMEAGVMPTDPEAIGSELFEDEHGPGARLTVTWELRP